MRTTDKSERIAQISHKLNTIQSGEITVVSRSAKLEQEDFRLTCMEERLREMQDEDQRSYNSVRDEIASIQKLMDEERQSREFMAETKLKELEGIDERLSSRMNHTISVGLTQDLNHEGIAREKEVEGVSRAVEENLTKINEAIRIANIEREESDADLLKKIGEGLEVLDQRTRQEKLNRESSEQAVYDLLKDVVSRVKNEIEGERKDRERSEESLIGLLEDTCNKIHVLSQNF